MADKDARRTIAKALEEARRVETELDVRDLAEDAERLDQITDKLATRDEPDS